MASKRDADQMELHTPDNSAMFNNRGDGTKKSKTMHNPPHNRRDSLDKKKHNLIPKDPSFNRDGCIRDDSEGDFDTKLNLQVGDHNEHSLQDSTPDHDFDNFMIGSVPEDYSADPNSNENSYINTDLEELLDPKFFLQVGDYTDPSMQNILSNDHWDDSMICGISNYGTEVTETCHKSNETLPDHNPKETFIGEKDTIGLIYLYGMCDGIIYSGKNDLNTIFRDNTSGIIGDVKAQYDTLFQLVSVKQRTIVNKTLERYSQLKDETKRVYFEGLKKKRRSAIRLISDHVNNLKGRIKKFADSFKLILEDVKKKTLVEKAKTYNEVTEQIFGHLVPTKCLKELLDDKLLDINAIEAQYEFLRRYLNNIGRELEEKLINKHHL